MFRPWPQNVFCLSLIRFFFCFFLLKFLFAVLRIKRKTTKRTRKSDHNKNNNEKRENKKIGEEKNFFDKRIEKRTIINIFCFFLLYIFCLSKIRRKYPSVM
ncbi:unnamed protein product [Meloidogyne enterolobii]|uniref:Uncharacterized protein n=1 Tax=Meloidogyne enterolobii TaxID=390850 RepID=A0ACB0YSS4_MELEN